MSLGDHLEELRRRLKWPLIALGLMFFGAFAVENHIQRIFAQPLVWAIQINPENAKIVGLPIDGTPPKLIVLDVWEAPMVSMKVSFYTAFFLAFPVLVYHLWMFIGVGLLPKERRLAFLFVPAGILFFYAGTLVGYFIGVPYFYSFMIKWAAHNPLLEFSLQLSSYHQNFVMMTMVFGLISDIPWLIMVLVRVGFVTVPQLIKHWRVAIIVNTLIAAVVAPPDAFSMIVMMVPLYGLYFLGVGMSALMMRRHRRLEAEEQKAELARMEAEERAAHEAHAAHASQQTQHAPETSDVNSPTETATNNVPDDASQPVPRSAIVDDLGTTDHAPSSDDQPVADHQSTMTGEGSAGDGEAPRPASDDHAAGPSDSDGKDDKRV